MISQRIKKLTPQNLEIETHKKLILYCKIRLSVIKVICVCNWY